MFLIEGGDGIQELARTVTYFTIEYPRTPTATVLTASPIQNKTLVPFANSTSSCSLVNSVLHHNIVRQSMQLKRDSGGY